MLYSIKLGGVGVLKNTLTLDMESQNLAFSVLVFGVVWSSISSLSFISLPCSYNVYSVPLYVEVLDLHLDFDFTRDYS